MDEFSGFHNFYYGEFFLYIIKYEGIFFFSSFGTELAIRLVVSCKKQIIWLISFSLGLFWIALCEATKECLGIFLVENE